MWQLIHEHKLITSIFVIALFWRIFNLASVPVGFHADEVRVAWNSFSILKTGLDDRGNSLALYYNTFGDYRPTGIFYLTIPSIFVFGLNEFAVRLPAAFFGALTVLPLYALAYQFTQNKKIALLAGLILAISPWWIQTSRTANEVVIAIFFALCSFSLLIHSIKHGKKYLLFAFISLLFSYLFYHSIRFLAPLGVMVIALYYRDKIQVTSRKYVLIFVLAVFGLSATFLLNPSAQKRFEQVSVVTPSQSITMAGETVQNSVNTLLDKPPLVYINSLIKEYFSYFSVDFLIGDSAKPTRYKSPSIGVLTHFELLLLVIGIIFIIRKKKYNLPLLLLIVAPLAAALTREDSPNLNRSLLMSPFIAIIVSIGLTYLYKYKKILALMVFSGLIINFAYFWHVYTRQSAPLVGFWRNYTAKDMVLALEELKENYETVIVTHDPDDPYPWYAFYTKKDPAEFNKYVITREKGPWQYNNIIFSQQDCPSGDIFPGARSKPLDKNILVIDGFKCPVESRIKDGMQAKVVKQINNPDGSVGYTFWIKK